ncbi:MAG: tRNA lysidine(34) synthetase TilS [Candidatus Baltobacteraceae bacterium]
MRGAGSERSLEAQVAATLAIQADEILLVAASGGPDSTALASLAASAARAAGGRVELGHVNHGVRTSAEQDEAVTLATGAALGLRVRCAYVRGAPSDEASLREARYAALASLARVAGAARVATAHHAEDQTETVLLALFRGTGPAGLAGMPPVRALGEGLELVRPLLRVEPARLRAYAERAHLPFALDPTNRDPRYRRNAVRAALAALRGDFPHLDEAVARCAELVREELAPTARGRTRAGLQAALRAAGLGRDLTFERLEAATKALESGVRGRVHLRRDVELVIGGSDEPGG